MDSFLYSHKYIVLYLVIYITSISSFMYSYIFIYSYICIDRYSNRSNYILYMFFQCDIIRIWVYKHIVFK